MSTSLSGSALSRLWAERRFEVAKVLKIVGLVVMLFLFFFVGAFLGSLIVDNALWWSKLLWTAVPAFVFGLLTGLATPKRWLLSGLATAGYIVGGIFGYPTIGPLTVADRLVFLILVPVGFAFLGGYIGRRLLPDSRLHVNKGRTNSQLPPAK